MFFGISFLLVVDDYVGEVVLVKFSCYKEDL